MKPQGELPSALEAKLVPALMHSDRPDEFDRMIGLVVGSQARAYPIGLLDRFEVVDDSAGDFSFVVARCALTGIVAVYSRRVEGRDLSFENSGALWRDTLVLRDQRRAPTDWRRPGVRCPAHRRWLRLPPPSPASNSGGARLRAASTWTGPPSCLSGCARTRPRPRRRRAPAQGPPQTKEELFSKVKGMRRWR
jgi:hypothetical protein